MEAHTDDDDHAHRRVARDFFNKSRIIIVSFILFTTVVVATQARYPLYLCLFALTSRPVVFLVDKLSTKTLFTRYYIIVEISRVIIAFAIYVVAVWLGGPNAPGWLFMVFPISMIAITHQLAHRANFAIPEDWSYTEMMSSKINYRAMLLCVLLSIASAATCVVLFGNWHMGSVALVTLVLESVLINWAVPLVHQTIEVNRLLVKNRTLQRRAEAAMLANEHKTKFIATMR
jgi:hypothetical protein